jgi:hypothetical protein
MTAAELHRKYGETATIPRDCPWVEPPTWWDQGLKAWGELLTEQWEIVKAKPKSPRQLQMEKFCRRTGEGRGRQITEIAIEILTQKERS